MVSFTKNACGSGFVPGSDIDYTGFMNDEGFFRTGTAGYNLRNSEDEITVVFWVRSEDDFLNVGFEKFKPSDFGSESFHLLNKTVALGDRP